MHCCASGAILSCRRYGSQDFRRRIARDDDNATILHGNLKCVALYIITGIPVNLEIVCGIHNSVFLFHAIARKAEGKMVLWIEHPCVSRLRGEEYDLTERDNAAVALHGPGYDVRYLSRYADFAAAP
jgi:hypothetical protein